MKRAEILTLKEKTGEQKLSPFLWTEGSTE